MDSAMLCKALEQLEQAAHDHAEWHDDLLRAIVCRLPGDPDDLTENAHQLCRFGQWYYERASDELRSQPTFAAMEVEHRRLHRIGARLLLAGAADAPIMRTDYEDLVASSARLHLQIESLMQQIRGQLRNRDALTGAYDRAEMLPALRDWHEVARRHVQPCCIVFMDLDHLKEINDSCGHPVGDEVLAGVVRYLIDHLRPYDKVFRYGGDEFVIALPGADLAAGQAVIRHIRDGLGRMRLVAAPGGIDMRVTASFGLALLDPDVSVEDCIDRADQALLLAKAAGRNHAINWDASVTTGNRLRRLELDDAGGQIAVVPPGTTPNPA
jgi:diguanylate cyclase (GGDEF)-like protein